MTSMLPTQIGPNSNPAAGSIGPKTVVEIMNFEQLLCAHIVLAGTKSPIADQAAHIGWNRVVPLPLTVLAVCEQAFLQSGDPVLRAIVDQLSQ